MFDIPNNPSITYLIYSLISLGIFLFISGLNIIKVEKIRVQVGLKTWLIGLFFIIVGALLLNYQEASSKDQDMAYICYKKQITEDNQSYTYENCQESSHPCSSGLTEFGIYHRGKELNMALQRCISNTPYYRDPD